jgi:hypothetical protein
LPAHGIFEGFWPMHDSVAEKQFLNCPTQVGFIKKTRAKWVLLLFPLMSFMPSFKILLLQGDH